jgi:hypothetical protein
MCGPWPPLGRRVSPPGGWLWRPGRAAEGLAAARECHGGKLPVRGPSITADQLETARTLARTHPRMSAARIADVIGVSRATLYRHVDVAALREGSKENGRS